jgi:hypothetical protein
MLFTGSEIKYSSWLKCQQDYLAALVVIFLDMAIAPKIMAFTASVRKSIESKQ